ncbi:MAG: YkvA family protein, partial [Alphaproteobacteria bacterium]
TPWFAKLLALLVAAYALSPIDLIPDAIPVLGFLDELILLPIAIALLARLIPGEIMAESRVAAQAMVEKPRSKAGAAIIMTIWALVAGALLWWVLR